MEEEIIEETKDKTHILDENLVQENPIFFPKIEKSAIKNLFIDLSFLQELPSISLTPDNGVIKYKTVEGKATEGILPMNESANIKIRYEGRKCNGELIDTKRDINQVKSVKMGNQDFIIGIQISIKSMLKGEISWFKLSPKYHYYANLTNTIIQENPIVKEDEDLFYKIELVDYENTYGILDNSDIDTRMQILEECRVKGNEYFKESEFLKARKMYSKGVNNLKNLPKVIKDSMTEETRCKFQYFNGVLNSNAAACLLKEGNIKESLNYARNAYEIDPSNPKYRYRFASCLIENQIYTQPIQILTDLLQEDNNNTEVRNKLILCKSKMKSKESSEGQMWKHALDNFHKDEEIERREKIMKTKRENKNKEDIASKDNREQFSYPNIPDLKIGDLEAGCIIEEGAFKRIIQNDLN